MSRVVFIGDELTAAGFRLAGALTATPDPERTAETFSRMRQECELLLISAEFAARLPRNMLTRAEREDSPLLLVVPDVRGKTRPGDPVRAANRALGIET